jgi:transcriptional regulator GlxA family with amidase domain
MTRRAGIPGNRSALHQSQCRQRNSVGDIVKHLDVSRRMLESRFRHALKRSPAAEIRRVRPE